MTLFYPVEIGWSTSLSLTRAEAVSTQIKERSTMLCALSTKSVYTSIHQIKTLVFIHFICFFDLNCWQMTQVFIIYS